MSKEMAVGNYLINGNERTITIKDSETTVQEFHNWLKESWIAEGMMTYPVPVTIEEVRGNPRLMSGYYLRVLSGWVIEGLVIDGNRKDYKSGDLIFLKKSKYSIKDINSSNNDGKLTPKQIKAWRRVLCAMIGPYALIAPDEEVQAIRDKMQKDVDDSRVGENE